MNHDDESALVLNLIEAFRRSKTMFTAVRLGIFDALSAAPQTAAALASRLNLDRTALTRLLDGCVALKLLARDGEPYINSGAAERYLTSRSPDTLAGYVTYSDQSLYKLWDHLDDAVREGRNRWSQTFGERASLFDHYFRNEVSTRNFLGGMHGFARQVTWHLPLARLILVCGPPSSIFRLSSHSPANLSTNPV